MSLSVILNICTSIQIISRISMNTISPGELCHRQAHSASLNSSYLQKKQNQWKHTLNQNKQQTGFGVQQENMLE